MKKGLALLLCVTMAAASGCAHLAAEHRVGLGVAGSDFYAVGEQLTTELTTGMTNTSFVPVETGGSAVNLTSLDAGDINMALSLGVQADAAYAGGMTKLRLLAPAMPVYLHLVASGASGIRSVADLKARRVSLGTTESGVYELAVMAIGYSELELKQIQRREMSYADAVNSMNAGELDAFFVFAAPGNAVIEELAASGAVIVPLEQRCAERIAENTGYTVKAIPAGSYTNQEGDVLSVTSDAWLVTTEAMPDQTAAEAARIATEIMASAFEARGSDVTQYTAKQLQTPYHSGVTGEKSDGE